IKVKQLMQLAVALCLLASKWLAKAGARLTPRRLNSSLGLCEGQNKMGASWLPFFMLAYALSTCEFRGASLGECGATFGKVSAVYRVA
ncbi:MAG: hypothetical protein RIQ69_1290, partial [Pseudomonadota bacterium]